MTFEDWCIILESLSPFPLIRRKNWRLAIGCLASVLGSWEIREVPARYSGYWGCREDSVWIGSQRSQWDTQALLQIASLA